MQFCFALNIQISKTVPLPKNGSYSVYQASDFPLVGHVVIFPVNIIDMKLVPALGQREEVSSIARRSSQSSLTFFCG